MIRSPTPLSTLLQCSLFGLLLCLVGCEDNPAGGPNPVAGAAEKNADLKPARFYYLSADEAAGFRPGQKLEDCLRRVQWRGEFGQAGIIGQGSATAIAYQLFSDDPDGEGSEAVYAIFLDDRFVKFVRWLPPETIVVQREGGNFGRPKPIEVGNLDHLRRLVDGDAIDLDTLQEEVAARPATPSQIDPGLTLAWIILEAATPGELVRGPSKEDYKRNDELRDQFNAARLKIGMSPAEVREVFKNEPLEKGDVKAGHYEIFGSNESLSDIKSWHRFSNVLVLYSDGKATAIYAVGAGDGWRSVVGDWFSDLPPAK